MITVAAVVVTRNRPALLKRCLEAIDSQTYPVRQLVVVDNASDEPTREFLAGETARRGADFHLIRLDENTGGAGGFHEGMRGALPLPCTHMWLMDDDCEPEPEAMAELVAATTVVGENAVLGSNVFDLNGENINVQAISQRPGTNGMPQYARYLADGLHRNDGAHFRFVPHLGRLGAKSWAPFEGVLHLGRRYRVFAASRSLHQTLSSWEKQDKAFKVGRRVPKSVRRRRSAKNITISLVISK